MARRAKVPTPLGLRINHDTKTQLFYVDENGITYWMPMELTRDLKLYYHHFPSGHQSHYPTMARWYSDLTKEKKKQVKRTGNIPQTPSDFFADPEYD